MALILEELQIEEFIDDQESIDDAAVLNSLKFSRIARNTTQTRSIVITEDIIEEDILDEEWFNNTERLPSFEHVTIKVGSHLMLDAFNAIDGRFVRKLTIHMFDIHHVSLHDFMRLIAECKVEEFELIEVREGVTYMHSQTAMVILDELPTLKSLTLSKFNFIQPTADHLRKVSHKNLTKLVLIGLTTIHSEFFQTILRATPHLQHLHISEPIHCREGLHGLSETLSQLPDLVRFEYSSRGLIYDFYERELLDALFKMHKLEDLKITCVNVAADSFARIAAAITNMHSLRRVELGVGAIQTPVCPLDRLDFNRDAPIESFIVSYRDTEDAAAPPIVSDIIASLKKLNYFMRNVSVSSSLNLFQLNSNALDTLTVLRILEDPSQKGIMAHAAAVASRCRFLAELELHGDFFGIVAPPKISSCVERITINARNFSSVFAFNVLEALSRPGLIKEATLSSIENSAGQYVLLSRWFQRACRISRLLLHFRDSTLDDVVDRDTFTYLGHLRELNCISLQYSSARNFSAGSLFTALSNIHTIRSFELICEPLLLTSEEEDAFVRLISTTGILLTFYKQRSLLINAKAHMYAIRNNTNFVRKNQNLLGLLLKNIDTEARISAQTRHIE